ncbi:MAG TPA: proline dehydrogenase family protein [Cyclobacteriaceae bacterium]|nr:proline dehydrogenase family protein [Cyclobacteriaceae bacterium]
MEIASKLSFENTEVAFQAKTDKELRKANFIFSIVKHHTIAQIATGAVKLGLALRLPVKGLIKHTVYDHFCAGENIEQSLQVMDHIGQFGVHSILDYSVEGEKSEQGFELVAQEVIRTVHEAKKNSNMPFAVFKMTGLASIDLLEKINAGKSLSEAEESAWEKVKARVDRICKTCFEQDIPVLIDAEETWIQNPIDALAYEMMRKYNEKKAIVYNTYQLYRRDSLANLRNAFHEAAMHNYFLGAKLVRGAYMEKERERAKKMGYADPIQPNKEATDADYNKALAFCVDNKQRISFVSGSHNEYSNQYLAVLMEKHSLNMHDKRVWFSQLYGMSDNISFNLAKAGYNVVKYLPYGPVEKVMPYLFRRAEENTSVEGQSSRELDMIRRELRRRKESR